MENIKSHAISSPSPAISSLDNKTLNVFEQRLADAEEDTHILSQQLSIMVSDSNTIRDSYELTDQESPRSVVSSPGSRDMKKEETLNNRNVDMLSSRLYKAESAVATLKLALTSLQNDDHPPHHLQQQQQKKRYDSKSSSSNQKKRHEASSVNQLQDELICLQQELVLEREAKTKARNEVRNLQDALMEASQIRADTSVKADNLEAEKQNLMENIAEMEKELVQERKLHENLELSHLALLDRIEQMETLVDSEKDEVRSLTAIYGKLREETAKSQSKSKEEHKQRVKVEKNCQQLLTEKKALEEFYTKSEDNNKDLHKELAMLQKQHTTLVTQMDELQSCFEQQQKNSQDLEALQKEMNKALECSKNEQKRLQQQHILYEQKDRKQQAELEASQQLVISQKSNIQSLETQNKELKQKLMKAEEELIMTGGRLTLKEEEVAKCEKMLAKENTAAKEQITRLQREKMKALNEKEKLEKQLQECNSQKVKVAEESRHQKVKLQTLETTAKVLEQENSINLERISELERLQEATEEVDHAMQDMLDQKKKLAYENGCLQSQVELLQSELKTMTNKYSELKEACHFNKTLDNKYIKCQRELDDCKMNIKRLEKQVAHLQKVNEMKEADFNLAIESRDKTLKDLERLKHDLNDSKNKDQHKMVSLQVAADNGKMDNRKLAKTLQSVIKSHGLLEHSVEEMQMELGRKDCLIEQFRKEKSNSQNENVDLQKELSSQQERLLTMASAQTNEFEQLRQSFLKYKADNDKMASTLEDMLNSNVCLQEAVNSLTAELELNIRGLKELKKVREKEQKEASAELKLCEGKLENMRDQFQRDKDQNIKRATKDVSEIKHQNDQLLNLNGEMRHKISELERANKEAQDRLMEQKCKIEYLQKSKKQLEENIGKVKTMKNDIDVLEKFRKEYIKKNCDQLTTIQTFQSQMSSLQLELGSLSDSPAACGSFSRLKEELVLQKTPEIKEGYLRNYLNNEKQEEGLAQLKQGANERLKCAAQESVQISDGLTQAKQGFEMKFEELQKELKNSQKMRDQMEQDHLLQENKLEEERCRAQETADRARAMLKASRRSLCKLAEFANQADLDTRLHIAQLQRPVDQERTTSAKFMDNQFQESSKPNLYTFKDLPPEGDFQR